MKRLLFALFALVTVFTPPAAQAWWRGGVFIGLPPVVVGPPVAAYPPPYYYAPGYYGPYAYYPPPPPASAPAQTWAPQLSQNAPAFGSMCVAGVYSCAVGPQTPVGSGCACEGIGAPSYGTVR